MKRVQKCECISFLSAVSLFSPTASTVAFSPIIGAKPTRCACHCHFLLFSLIATPPRSTRGIPLFVKNVNEVTAVLARRYFLPQVTTFRGCRTKVPMVARINKLRLIFLASLPLAQRAFTAALDE